MKCWHLVWSSRRGRRRRRPPWLIFSNPIESNKGERSGISWINSAVKMYGAPCAAASCDKSDALGNYFTGRPEWQHDQPIGSPAPAAQSSGKHHRLIFSVALAWLLQCWTCSHRPELHIYTCWLEAQHFTVLSFTLTSLSLRSWLLTCRVTDTLIESFGRLSGLVSQTEYSTSTCIQYSPIPSS